MLSSFELTRFSSYKEKSSITFNNNLPREKEKPDTQASSTTTAVPPFSILAGNTSDGEGSLW